MTKIPEDCFFNIEQILSKLNAQKLSLFDVTPLIKSGQNFISWNEVAVMMTSLAIITSKMQQRYGTQLFCDKIRDQLPTLKTVIIQLKYCNVSGHIQIHDCELSSNTLLKYFARELQYHCLLHSRQNYNTSIT